MKEFIKSMLSAEKGSVSSKRVCGVIGWIVVLSIYLISLIRGNSVPNDILDLIIGCCVLLGVDSVTSIWRKNND
jgi:hypothetical protein